MEVDLGAINNIGKVDLYPRNDSGYIGVNFPIDFTIQVSSDNTNWTTVVTQTGYAQPGNAVQSFTFSDRNARYVKVQGTNLRPDASGNYMMAFAEMEVYNNGGVAPTPTPAPLSTNRTVTASSSAENWDWYKSKVADGQRNSISGAMGWTSYSNLTANHTEWVEIDMDTVYNIGKVDLYPRNDTGHVGEGFPIDFTIQVSADYINWNTVVTQTGFAKPGNEVQSFTFSDRNARYIKVQGTNLRPDASNNYMMKLAEIEVYNGSGAAPTPAPASLSLYKPYSASSSFESYSWGKADVIDGNRSSIPCAYGWSSYSNLTGNHTEWVTIDLESNCNISKVDLYSRNDAGHVGDGFPIDFTIQASTDGINWNTVVTRTGYAKPENAVQSFTFTSRSARYVKVQGTNLRPDASNNYMMQLAEIEVY